MEILLSNKKHYLKKHSETQYYLSFMEQAFFKVFIIWNILKKVLHFTFENGKIKTPNWKYLEADKTAECLKSQAVLLP